MPSVVESFKNDFIVGKYPLSDNKLYILQYANGGNKIIAKKYVELSHYCAWCGKKITKEQNDKYDGCCNEEHMDGNKWCSSIFNPW